jgi:integrase
MTAGHSIAISRGGGYMGGSCHYNEGSKRWFVSVYWQGNRFKIWKYNGEPLWAEQTATKLVNRIRTEIDEGTFLPKAYLPDSPVTLKAISKAWFGALSVAPATKKFYEKAVGHALKYFGEDQDIRKFHHSQLQTFYNELPLTVKGKYHVLNTLKTMLRFAYQDEIIKKVPPFPKLPQGQKDCIKYLTYEEQQRVLSHIPDRHRGIFEFAMEYGLRIGEVCALQRDCVTDTEIIIKRAISDGELRLSTKTGRVRLYGITKRAKDILEEARNSRVEGHITPYVFTRPDGKPYTWKSLTCWWRSATKKAGITINLYNGIRHSLGCQLMDQGVEMEMVRDVLGHTSTNTTRMYAKRSSASITNVLQWRGKISERNGESICLQKQNGR